MKKVLIFFAVLYSLNIGVIYCEIFDHSCRSLDEYGGVATDFQAEKYLGKWFEIERYEQFFQRNQDCCFAEYKTNPDSTINVINRSKNLTGTGIWTFAEGKAVVSFPDENPLRAMLNVTFPAFRYPDRSNYWILSTDYINYSIVVNCRAKDENKSIESYWLLSRTPQVSEEGRKIADEIINNKLDKSRIRITVQDAEKCQFV